MAGVLDGKVALVTGAARGIGAAAAKKLAGEGASVLVTDLRQDEGRAVVNEIANAGGKADFFQHDVTDESSWEAACQRAEDAFGALHIVVNNAGVAAASGPIEDLALDDWRGLMAINLDGVFLGCKHGIRTIKKYSPTAQGGGAIINLSSIMGLVGFPGSGAYNASKGGVRLLTKVAALECAQSGYNIRVNSVHPGFVHTNLVTDAMSAAAEREDSMFGSANEAMDMLVMAHPIGRLGVPDDIANAILFLASDKAAFMTGTELVADGGYTAR